MSTVVPIVSRAVHLGLLDDFEEGDRTFICRISGWADEQQRARETTKKAAQRAAAHATTDAVEPTGDAGQAGTTPVRPVLSPVVPECPPTGQDRTEELLPPQPPASGGRQRDKDRFKEQMTSFAADHFPGIHVGYVEEAIRKLRRTDAPPTVAAIRWMLGEGGIAA